jgi:uncharacterized protein YceH (UPF0502 family)
MKYQLNGTEARVIGCLLEKQVTTPEQYPLSVNAVTMACNQKTNREPVMNLSEHEVQDVLDALVKRHYLRTVSGFGNRVTKYEQRFCNSEFGDLKLSSAEVAVITTLLLRGAQTPGELRTRASRMHEFSDMQEVEQTLEGLAAREDGPYVVRLAREPGKRESRYMHLFSGDVDSSVKSSATDITAVDDDLAARVEALEDEVAGLKQRLDACWHIWETDGEKITHWRGGAGRYCAKSLAAGSRGSDGLDAARGMVTHAREGRADLRNLAYAVCGVASGSGPRVRCGLCAYLNVYPLSGGERAAQCGRSRLRG